MGRLTSATDNATSSVLVRYEYDPLGRKIKRISPTEIIYFIYNGWQVIEEYTQATASDPVNLSKYHVYGQYIDELIATGIMNEATETIHYFHAGLNHNVEAITDASGSLVSYYTYDAFGSATEYPTGNASGNTTLFQGREWDDQAGLYYFRNRWYSPEMGRFISRDPIDFQAGDVNLYRFVGNGPVNGVDPWGLQESGKTTIPLGGKCSMDAPCAPNAPASNCAGYGLTGEAGKYISLGKLVTATGLTVQELLDDSGRDCKLISVMDECNCECNQTKEVLSIWYDMNEDNQGKDAFNDPTYDWDPNYTDYHVVRANVGCTENYTHVKECRCGAQEPTNVTVTELENSSHAPAAQKLCCCRDR